MGTVQVLRSTYPRLTRGARKPVDFLGRIGDHMLFYLRALAGVPHASVHFRKEIVRLIA
ncbi:ABC transporter permease, partial [Mycolicibacterium sp. XJ2]